MKTVFVLSSCDAWHSYSSFRTIGIFSTMKKLLKYLKKCHKLKNWEIEQISTIGQTQGRHENFFVEEMKII